MTSHQWLAGWLATILLLVPLATVAAQKTTDRNSSKESERKDRPATEKSGPDLERVKQLIVNLTNQFRRQQGRGELHVNPQLNRAAQYFADYLARTDEFSHTADGKEPWERVAKYGYDYSIVDENIAWEFDSSGFSTRGLAEKLVEGWKKSPGHRKNMLDPDVTEIGIGVARSKKTGRYYSVQDFGRPKSKEISFEISNDTDDDVRYQVDGKDFTVRPGYTVTHQRGRPPKLTFSLGEKESKSYQPGNGDHYKVRKGSGDRLVVEEE